MAFVDQHGAVLAARDLAALDAVDGAQHVLLHLGRHRQAVIRLVHLVGGEHLGAPGVEVLHHHPLAQAPLLDHLAQSTGQGLVVAEHQDGFDRDLGQMGAAIAEDHGLAAAGGAVDDAVAVAQGAGQLFLLQVHDLDQTGQGCVGGVEQAELAGLAVDPYLGVEVIPHPVDLRQAEGAGKDMGEHVPEALLEGFRVGGLGHLVLEQHPLGVEDVGEVGLLELTTGDAGEHHAPAPGHDQLARMGRAGALAQQRVLFQQQVDFEDVGAGLQQGIGNGLEAVLGVQAHLAVGDGFQGGELPVLDLQYQDAATWMQHDEIRIAGLGAYRDIAPAEVVVFEQLFQAFGETAFTRGIELALAASGEKAGHRSSIPRCGQDAVKRDLAHKNPFVIR